MEVPTITIETIKDEEIRPPFFAICILGSYWPIVLKLKKLCRHTLVLVHLKLGRLEGFMFYLRKSR
jgi:hypothetical protein